jgi:hypothetical protein
MSSKQALVDRIAAAGGGDPKRIAAALKDEQIIIWTTADVIGAALDRGIAIGAPTARRILETAVERHDANNGINWDVLNFWIDEQQAGRL